MKNRKIGYTYSSVSGHFAFRNKKSISFESTLERDLLTAPADLFGQAAGVIRTVLK